MKVFMRPFYEVVKVKAIQHVTLDWLRKKGFSNHTVEVGMGGISFYTFLLIQNNDVCRCRLTDSNAHTNGLYLALQLNSSQATEYTFELY